MSALIVVMNVIDLPVSVESLGVDADGHVNV